MHLKNILVGDVRKIIIAIVLLSLYYRLRTSALRLIGTRGVARRTGAALVFIVRTAVAVGQGTARCEYKVYMLAWVWVGVWVGVCVTHQVSGGTRDRVLVHAIVPVSYSRKK